MYPQDWQAANGGSKRLGLRAAKRGLKGSLGCRKVVKGDGPDAVGCP
jgi:hypothetical protein